MKLMVYTLALCWMAKTSPAPMVSPQERSFLDASNRLVTHTVQYHWRYDDVPMQVDSLFHVLGDTLSITWKYTVNNAPMRTRLAAPLSKIRSVSWDHYLVLQYGSEKLVQVYEQTSPETGWRLIGKEHLLHIARVAGTSKRERRNMKAIEKAFDQYKRTLHHE